jgi:hypothetical protein
MQLKVRSSSTSTSFRCFRHSLRDSLRNARVERNTAYALSGWVGDTGYDKAATAECHGRGSRTLNLAEAVEQITYPDFDLFHLGSAT